MGNQEFKMILTTLVYFFLAGLFINDSLEHDLRENILDFLFQHGAKPNEYVDQPPQLIRTVHTPVQITSSTEKNG